ncbi:hypothetical protein B0H10DRAFT_1845936, partial [Mycena sp. CBHHK59/15]
RREVYHKVCSVIFESLVRPSRDGETVKCGDEIDRVLFPGIPFHSLAGEEACACRAALANFPCPRCLVPKADLHSLLKKFTPRTTASMKRVCEDACIACNKTEQERILQSHGMAKMPPWRDLKHFPHVTTIEYTDGQAFFDILKSLIDRRYELDTHTSHVVCIKAYSQYRLMVGLRCTTEERTTRLKGYIKKYERFCSEHGKSFDFPKHYSCAHILYDLREEGTTNHYTTRLGEGFHQEVNEAYAQTNEKKEDPQVNKKSAT